LDGHVQEPDVLVIVAGTKFDPHNDDDWEHIYYGYKLYWDSGYAKGGIGHGELAYRELTIQMYDNGKIHQPRLFDDAYRFTGETRWGSHWRDLVLIPEDLAQKPAVQHAWEQFQIVGRLSDVQIID
jgi:hypothetical protein